ncbi:MAG: FtsW/RodA/SpoVE family cell cycle protein [Gemmatimonadetes bacterium]|nr:cell division protein FtsW [Gemmatimonadota bacterium]NIR80136.1 cell division protein FtsW [Gemmatimonadota bacterium]NIT88888.1 cell division protein FtsW [Gemmatimonadota bacterium]NIU32691.1 cell division protein FtsW [Gemmatimonadota bacterium]NIU37130.1 FtsW/RodA/SpoVE family cell cycle protein [Gemmatimonadota bacterium]
MAGPVDVAPAGPVTLPETGLGRGWEPAALLGITLLLLSFGLVSLYSASQFLAQSQGRPDYYYVLRQAVGATGGLGVLVVCSRIPYRWWRVAAWPLLGLTWILLVLVVAPGTEEIAPRINGARRWLRIGVTVQPSELAKIAVVIWSASLALKKLDRFRSLSRGLLPFLLVWVAMAVPILLEPDLSTAALVVLLGVLVVYAAGGRIGHFVFLGLLAAPLVWTQVRVAYRAQRMAAFLDPTVDPGGAGFQVRQSLIAVGSGGITGVGFGEGRQKFGFLPEPHNDFIFALIGEEWGLLGVLFLVLLYTALVLVGYRVARRAPDLFGQLMAIGLTNLVVVQAVLHMAVGLGVAPPTGLALPLVSYGRSNLVVTLASLGILISVARRTTRGRARGA